jgi:hypothetical protein
MITWIAGAPHNGSTLLRQIIHQSFGITTFSRYAEKQLDPILGEGLSKFSEEYRKHEVVQYKWLRENDAMAIMKTHEIPVDDGPAIFVVRDGRDAAAAVSHFWKIPIKYAIAGQYQFPGWSDYFWAWNPLERPNTILVRFEDMVADGNKVAREQLAPFFGVEPVAEFVDRFEENQKNYPQLFHDPGTCWESRMTESDLDLFWKCHGSVMKVLGYGRKGPGRADAR